MRQMRRNAPIGRRKGTNGIPVATIRTRRDELDEAQVHVDGRLPAP